MLLQKDFRLTHVHHKRMLDHSQIVKDQRLRRQTVRMKVSFAVTDV